MTKNTTHEQKIIEKLDLLLDLLEENYSESAGDYLIAPDQLDVLDMISKVKKGILPDRDDLMKMNVIWRKNQRIKKCGGISEYEKSFWSKIDEHIRKNNLIQAIKIIRQYITNNDGELLGLNDAKKIVEDRKAELEL